MCTTPFVEAFCPSSPTKGALHQGMSFYQEKDTTCLIVTSHTHCSIRFPGFSRGKDTKIGIYTFSYLVSAP